MGQAPSDVPWEASRAAISRCIAQAPLLPSLCGAAGAMAAAAEFWATHLTPGQIGASSASLLLPEGRVLCITSITAQGCPAQVSSARRRRPPSPLPLPYLAPASPLAPGGALLMPGAATAHLAHNSRCMVKHSTPATLPARHPPRLPAPSAVQSMQRYPLWTDAVLTLVVSCGNRPPAQLWRSDWVRHKYDSMRMYWVPHFGGACYSPHVLRCGGSGCGAAPCWQGRVALCAALCCAASWLGSPPASAPATIWQHLPNVLPAHQSCRLQRRGDIHRLLHAARWHAAGRRDGALDWQQRPHSAHRGPPVV